jgi:hypothetical protein
MSSSHERLSSDPAPARYELHFGERRVAYGVLAIGAPEAGSQNPQTTIVLEPGALDAGVDFASKCQLYERTSDGSLAPVSGGWVFAAYGHGDEFIVELRALAQQLAEGQTGGLAVSAGAQGPALLWSMMRQFGVAEDQFSIEGYIQPEPSSYEVTIPLEGLAVDSPLPFSDVTLLPEDAAPLHISNLSADAGELIQAFRNGDCWAWTTVQASTLHEAEEIGVSRVDAAVAWISASGAYSFSIAPDGRRLTYARQQSVLGRISMSSTVHVKSMTGADRWLRNRREVRQIEPFSMSYLLDRVDMPQPGGPRSSYLSRAAVLWHRAMVATQLYDSVALLWQALELYARDAPVPNLFAKADRTLLKSSVVDSLSPAQQQRLDDKISELNSAPLMVRLTSALQHDGVPMTEDELDVLRRTRSIRNAMEHGQIPTAPEVRDVHQAVALLGRILVRAGAVR